MHDACLHRGLGKGGGDRLGEALQPIHDGDQDVLDPAVAQLVHDAEPELGALVLRDPETENLPGAFRGDTEGQVDGVRHGPRTGGGLVANS